MTLASDPHRAKPRAQRSAKPPRGAAQTGTHFGFETVAEADKGARVRGVFQSVSARYDLMNDLMSGGVHRLWKQTLIDRLNPRPGMSLVDVAGGTGDIALRVIERLGPKRVGPIVICDLTEAMLDVGRDRLIDRGQINREADLHWLCGDAEALPLGTGSMDACTIAFGLRNVTRIDRALEEARRVLRPGGRFLCLEFSHVVLPVLDRLYDRYSFTVIPALGGLITGDRDAYRYLVESIRRFPAQEVLATRMAQAGFERVSYRNLSGGIAALHSAWRL